MPLTIDGNSVSGADPVLKDGTMWVPLRTTAQALGASADWESSNQVAILNHGGNLVTIKAGDASIDVNGSPLQLQAAPYVENGQTWVPVRFFADALGLNLNVDTDSKSVDISGATADSGGDPMGDPGSV